MIIEEDGEEESEFDDEEEADVVKGSAEKEPVRAAAVVQPVVVNVTLPSPSPPPLAQTVVDPSSPPSDANEKNLLGTSSPSGHGVAEDEDDDDDDGDGDDDDGMDDYMGAPSDMLSTNTALTAAWTTTAGVDHDDEVCSLFSLCLFLFVLTMCRIMTRLL